MDSEDKVVDTIATHKVILAVHNEYFRAISFGTGAFFKEGKDGIVVVTETTKEAFLDLLGFIYEKDIDFENKSLTDLFEILNLAQRYQVDKLKDVVSKYINNFPITMDNVAMVVNTALDLSNIFDEVLENLLKSCADLLSKQDSNNLCYFCKDPCSSLQDMKQHIMTVHNVKLSVAQLKKILKEKNIKEKSKLA